MKSVVRFLAPIIACLPLCALAEPVDINTADAQAISEELEGVGLTKAEAIVEYREKHGPFRSAEDLSLVKGIGDKTVEINRENIKISKSGNK